MKNFEIKNQNGRSMIEMLGVLAIIGVLSVGGIAGYSQAMMKYRINKTIEQITLIAGNVRTFFAQQRNYADIKNYDTKNIIIKKAKLVPDEMWNGDSINGVWGNSLNIAADYETPEFFLISFKDIPEEACIELVTHSWPDETQAILFGDLASNLGSSSMSPYTNCSSANRREGFYTMCKKDKALPVSIDDAIKGCTCTNSLCEISLAFK